MKQFQKRRSSTLTYARLGILKDNECRKKFRQRVLINIGLCTKKRADDADSFTKCTQDAAKKTLPVLAARKKFAHASAEARSMYNSVSVACTNTALGGFIQYRRLRRRLRRQLERVREDE
ncbi:hypothetical protein RB195_008070 [Necator americanus]|uniref:Uncharacterized protein n=1 Tax=Necator americanus TaxID=51031 RepID=A0ABR1C1U2_NECAM